MEIEVNDNNFEEKVLEESKEKLVIVDFWAEWCMPCLMLGPNLKKVADENPEEIVLAKLNVDKNPILSQKYGISSIPAVKFFRNGEIMDEFIGALPESSVREYIEKNLK